VRAEDGKDGDGAKAVNVGAITEGRLSLGHASLSITACTSGI
jgi:hypothetical protein